MILDENDQLVTDRYNIQYNIGILTVYAKAITITSDDLIKQYDGTPLETLAGGFGMTSGEVSTRTFY